jgi:tRNA uridine 5-carbamoylmethylation protein Kti12
MTENNKIPKETEEKILKKFDRELQEEGEAMIEDYSDDMMQWTKNDVLNKIKQTISLAFEECKKQTKEEVLKLIDEWTYNNSFKYDDECTYCERNVNHWIILVKELKSKLSEVEDGK